MHAQQQRIVSHNVACFSRAHMVKGPWNIFLSYFATVAMMDACL
jgi:hypothetical protein